MTEAAITGHLMRGYRVFPDDPAELNNQNSDGSYTPLCPLCGWEGKSRAVHADAMSAVRAHIRGKRHMALKAIN